MPQDDALDLDAVLNIDAGKVTRTIRAKAETPSQINEMFDGITYQKGGAVLAMVENYVGEETFRRGVHNYLCRASVRQRDGRGFLECPDPDQRPARG